LAQRLLSRAAEKIGYRLKEITIMAKLVSSLILSCGLFYGIAYTAFTGPDLPDPISNGASSLMAPAPQRVVTRSHPMI
jgi:hypothetical protein